MNKRYFLIVCAFLVSLESVLNISIAAASPGTATAYIMVQMRKPTILPRVEQDFSEKEYTIYKCTQAFLLKSDESLITVLMKREISDLPSVKAAVKKGNPVEWLKKNIDVRFPGNAELMSVSCTLDNVTEAHTLIDAVVDAYIKLVECHERDSLKERIEILEDYCMSLEQKLRKLKEQYILLTPDISGNEGDAHKNRPTVELQMMQLQMSILEKEIIQFNMELDRQKIELKAPPRVKLLKAAE